MKVGDKVFVYQDGKMHRQGTGVVLRQHNGHHLIISLEYEGQTEVVKVRKLKRSRKWGGGIRYGGWSENIPIFSPWFLVIKDDYLKGVKP